MATPPRVAVYVDMLGGYGRGILVGISAYVRAHSPWIFFGDPERAVSPLPPLQHWDGDGVIAQVYSPELRRALSDLPIPVVNVSALLDDSTLPAVTPDQHAVGVLAAEYFRDRGFSQFAYCGFAGHRYSKERGEAFEQRVRQFGGTCDTYASDPSDVSRQRWEHEQERLSAWMRGLPRPVAIFCCNDTRARHLTAAASASVRVPEEVAILGADNDELICTFSNPPLSSVDVAVQRVGYEAAALLDRLMSRLPRQPQPILVPPAGVITRRSSDVLAIADPEVALAVRFIRENAHAPMQVDDVVDATTTSRRVLERRFRATLNRSIAQEIALAHLDRAKELLLHTDMRTTEVADRSGFRYVQHFNALFKRHMGCSPARYRKRLGRA